MDPLDTDRIESEIERSQSRKGETDDRLEETNRVTDRLPTLQTCADDLGDSGDRSISTGKARTDRGR